MTDVLISTWNDVCELNALPIGRGVCALVDGVQVALFRITADDVFAVSNFDPFSRSFVMSRGLVGSRGDVPKVASPMYKQSFDLRDGTCIDDPSMSLDSYDVRVRDGRIEVRVR